MPETFGFDRPEPEFLGRVGFLVAAVTGLCGRLSFAPVLAGHLGIHSPL